MKILNILAVGLLSFGLMSRPAVRAADKNEGKSSVTVTGCLSQGDEAKEFSIKDDNGKTYGLFATRGVNLKPHLGHKVTVTGTPTKEHEGQAKHEAKAGKTEESEHLQVTNLKMVSTTCP